jgi:hypothetical protein
VTRRDYIFIANAIWRARRQRKLALTDATMNENELRGIDRVAHAIGYSLKDANPAFDLGLFLENCGVHSEG